LKDALLQVRELKVRAGAFHLRDISFSLAVEEYLTVVGPTGCGKTVLLDSLAGLRRVSGGSVVFAGREIIRLPPEKRHLGYSCQNGLLFPFASVEENIWFGARARGMANDPAVRKRMRELVERLRIGHLLGRRPAFLSGGERQRVSLARAILTGPRLMLLDEPLSALDPRTRGEIRNLLRDLHRAGGMGFIHVTHDFSEALALGNSMAVMNAGRIEQKGPAMEVFLRPASLFTAEFLCGENLVPGTVRRWQGQTWFAVREGPLLGPLPAIIPIGPAAGLIRAGHLRLDHPSDSPGPVNSWTAVVDSVVVDGTDVDIFCRGGGLWQASVSLSDWHDLRLVAGDSVTLSVRPENIHMIPG
jgi:molybdate transport system ATP-binding protein